MKGSPDQGVTLRFEAMFLYYKLVVWAINMPEGSLARERIEAMLPGLYARYQRRKARRI